MLVFFTSDLHGKKVLYDQVISLVVDRKPSILILGGDLLPKSNSIRDLCTLQNNFIKQELTNFFCELHAVHNELEVGIMLGNDDLYFLCEGLFLLEGRGLIKLIDGRKWSTRSGWDVIGFNFVPETPFALKDLERRDCKNAPVRYPSAYAIHSEKKSYKSIDARHWFSSHTSLKEELDDLSPIVESSKTIFVSHSPPYDTPLDVKLSGDHVGSRSIRTYIETRKPSISLHGHIHESYLMTGVYCAKLGNTTCFNPGQIHYPHLDAILFDTKDPMNLNEHIGKSFIVSEQGLAFLRAPLS